MGSFRLSLFWNDIDAEWIIIDVTSFLSFPTGLTTIAGFHAIKCGVDADGFGYMEIDGERVFAQIPTLGEFEQSQVEFTTNFDFTNSTVNSLVVDNLKLTIFSGTEE